jgi:D-arabinose 1-dehydrogenase-like Zn-dependent alcohol dehydrogenase
VWWKVCTHPRVLLSQLTPLVPWRSLAEVGADVSDLRRGDRVVLSLLSICEACDFCRAGKVHLCDSFVNANRGLNVHGALMSRVSLPPTACNRCCAKPLPNHVIAGARAPRLCFMRRPRSACHSVVLAPLFNVEVMGPSPWQA